MWFGRLIGARERVIHKGTVEHHESQKFSSENVPEMQDSPAQGRGAGYLRE